MNAVAAAARASIASDGRWTLTASGFSGLAVAPRTARTSSTLAGSVADVDRGRCDVRPRARCSAASRPMSAARSSSGASGSESRMPTTVNQRPAIQTRIGASRSTIPRRAAATEPSTTVGYRASAASRNRPTRTVPPSVPRSEPVHGLHRQAARLAAARSGRSGARSPGATSRRSPTWTGRIRRIMPIASSGRAVSSPRNDWPGETVSMLVPSRSEDREQRRPAGVRDGEDGDHRRDPDRDPHRSEEGSQLARGQAAPGDPRDLGRSRTTRTKDPGTAVARGRGDAGGRCAAPRAPRWSRHDPPVLQLDAAGQRCREVAVVGDHRDRRAVGGVEVAEQVHEGSARHGSRLPVGSSARTMAGRPTSARATATRWRSPPESCPGRCRARWARPTRSRASSAARRRSRAGTPR